jgi:hypothetical protein
METNTTTTTRQAIIRADIENGARAVELVKEMLTESGNFTVYDFGYEKLFPEIALRQNNADRKGGISVVRQIRFMPDLLVVDEQRGKVYPIEVKHYKKFTPSAAYREAKKYVHYWPNAYLMFIAEDGVRMELISNTVKRKSVKMAKLSKDLVPLNVQSKYLEHLMALK